MQKNPPRALMFIARSQPSSVSVITGVNRENSSHIDSSVQVAKGIDDFSIHLSTLALSQTSMTVGGRSEFKRPSLRQKQEELIGTSASATCGFSNQQVAA